jgi:hypothetical protein
MENREITVKDLQKGDEVIIHGNGYIRYVKLLRPLKLRTGTNYRGDIVYSSIKCSFIDTSNTWDKTGSLTGDGHNKEAYVDFNYRNVWLVKRENNELN